MNRRVAFAIVLGGIVACQVVAGIEHVDKQQRGVGADGSSPDAGPGQGGPDASDPCDHLMPVPMPANDDAPEEEVPPFYLALRTVKLVPGPTDRYQGFDLDGTCTCDRREGTAHAGGSSCTPKSDDCDRDGGVDNAATKLFETFAPAGFDPDAPINESLGEGRRGLLLYVTKYNGKPNDRDVQVGAMLSHGILDGSGCGTTPDPKNDNRAPPGWCGRDRWSYSPTYVRPGSKEPTFRATGYVNDGELVFDAPGGELEMFFNSTVLKFGSPITAGRLTQSNGTWKLDGILTGRIPAKDMLRAIGNYESNDQFLCTQPALFQGVRTTVCRTVDITGTKAFDFLEPKNNCNAISSTIRFTAEEASVGEEHDEPGAPAGCGGVDPSAFECPP